MDRRRAPLRLSAFLLLAAAALPLAAAEPRKCEVLRQWALDNQDNVPHDYRGLLAYPLDQRRAIYDSLSAGEKAAFWSDKIEIYLAQHPALNVVQKRAIAEGRAVLSADVYEALAKKESVSRLRLQQWVEHAAARIAAALGDGATRELFYTLGPPPASDTHSAAIAAPDGDPSDFYCDCRTLADCDSSMTFCGVSPLGPCGPVPLGCGFGHTQTCTGTCQVF